MENNAGNETHDAFMASLECGPYVYREDGAYVFLPYRDRPHQYYDISDCVCNTAEDVVGWIAHMIEKRWVTRKHIEQFTLLAIQQIGIRRR